MDINRIRKDFPILKRRINGKPIIYLDNACQSLRPRQVIAAMNRYYEEFPACSGRSVHKFATSVSIEIDEARERIARYTGAGRIEEICFARNCTEALNTVIFGIGLKKDDRVLSTDREHNSIHIPLLILKDKIGIKYNWVKSKKDETFDLDRFSTIMSDSKVKLVAMCHTSNVNGTTIPARDICEIAHDNGALVLLDGAQYAPYGEFDLKKIKADFYAFSSHKMCGPSGVGVLTGAFDSLSQLSPMTYGGHGIAVASRTEAELLPPPERFEAGLQNYSGMIGAGIAAEYLQKIGRKQIQAHVKRLNIEATKLISDIYAVDILPPENGTKRGGILGFNIKGRNPHDLRGQVEDNGLGGGVSIRDDEREVALRAQSCYHVGVGHAQDRSARTDVSREVQVGPVLLLDNEFVAS